MRARINRNADQYRLWLSIFGTDEVSIIEPPRENAEGRMRMLVDVSKLDGGQCQRLATVVAKTRRIPSDRILEEMQGAGSIAISAEDVEIVEEVGRLF